MPRSNDSMWAKYWLVCWVGLCAMLIAMFVMDEIHNSRVDRIFDEYDTKMKELHETFKD